MGYTHYFRTHKDGIPQSAWVAICKDVKTLLSNLPDGVEVAWESDEPNRAPEVSDSLIRFNGIGRNDAGEDLSHETFYFERVPVKVSERDTDFAFCKTARKPYDLVVCGVLLVINKHAQEYVRVTSDGDHNDWQPAVEWVKDTLGEFYPLPTSILVEALGAKQVPPDALSPITPEPVFVSHTFVVDVKEFRAALELAVTERKTSIPVLQTVSLQPQESSLRVLSTDLDKWTVTDVPAMIDDDAENFLLPRHAVLAILKGETGILKITTKQNFWVRLEVGGCEYDIPSMDSKNFPACPQIPAVGFTVPGAALKASLGRIMPSISTEESRYTINGGLLECVKDKLLLVGTDGHRLAMDAIWIEGIPEGKSLVRSDALAWLYKHGVGDVKMSFGEKDSFFHVPDAHTTFITRNLTGKFPNYEAVVPRQDSFTTTAVFPSGAELGKTLTKVARMADERSGAVKFYVNGRCVLSAESTDTGKASATVPASIKHSQPDTEIAMGFNSFYVQDVLKVAGKGEIILSLKDRQSAGMFTVPALPEYRYILMPMRL